MGEVGVWINYCPSPKHEGAMALGGRFALMENTRVMRGQQNGFVNNAGA